MSPLAAAWCPSGAMPCPCSIPPASWPSTSGRASTPASSTSSHMGPSFLVLDQPPRRRRRRPRRCRCDHRAAGLRRHQAASKPGQIRYTLLLNDDRRRHRRPDDRPLGRLGPARSTSSSTPAPRRATSPASTRPPRGKATFQRADDGALLALQGPEAVDVMAAHRPRRRRSGLHAVLRQFDWGGTNADRFALRLYRRGRLRNPRARRSRRRPSGTRCWPTSGSNPIGLGARDPSASRPACRSMATTSTRPSRPSKPVSASPSPSAAARPPTSLAPQPHPHASSTANLDPHPRRPPRRGRAGPRRRRHPRCHRGTAIGARHLRRLRAHRSAAQSPSASSPPSQRRPGHQAPGFGPRPRRSPPKSPTPLRPPSLLPQIGQAQHDHKFTDRPRIYPRRGPHRHRGHHPLCAGAARRHRLRRAARSRPRS